MAHLKFTSPSIVKLPRQLSASFVREDQRGYVMVISMLIILLITIMSISMAKSFFLEEGMAGNLREKSRSFASAQEGLRYAEWFALNSGANGNAVTCPASGTLSSNTVCTNAPTFPTTGGGTPLQAYWSIPAPPTGLNLSVTKTTAKDTFYDNPGIYIYSVGPTQGHGYLYQVTAFGYGGTSAAVSLVQSSLVVHCTVTGGQTGQSPC